MKRKNREILRRDKIFTKDDLHKSWGNALHQRQLYQNSRLGLYFIDVRILEMERWTTELVQMIYYTASVKLFF